MLTHQQASEITGAPSRVAEATLRGYRAGKRGGRLRSFVRQECGFSPLMILSIALWVWRIVQLLKSK